jgi:hypothetical protein
MKKAGNNMKPVTVNVGIIDYDVRDNRRVLVGVNYVMDVQVDMMGFYGILSDPSHIKRNVTVLLPDWVESSIKSKWPMSRPGFTSDSGTGDLCFVTCKTPVKLSTRFDNPQVVDYEGMMQKAIDGGFLFHYPEMRGNMKSIDVSTAI